MIIFKDIRKFYLILFPGLHPLLRGDIYKGILYIISFFVPISVILLNLFRLEEMFKRSFSETLAGLLFLSAIILLVWFISFREVSWSINVQGKKSRNFLDRMVTLFGRNRKAFLGIIFVCVIFSIAILAPFLAPYDPNLQLDVINKRLLPPSPRFPLGTDELSRDLLSRIIYGSRISISIGLLSAAIAIFLGTLVGLISGYMAGKTDVVLMRLVDILLGFPRFFLILLVIAFFKPSIFIIVIVLSLVSWMEVSRLVRAQVLSLKEQEFVTAAKSMGIGAGRIIFAHILPNTVAPVIIAGALRVGSTILLEASLSFLGLGVQPPTASWGNIVNSGSLHLTDAWWISTFSGIAIIFTVVSFNLVGDGLRDIMDPRLRIRGDI